MWQIIRDGDPRAYAMFQRHYSALPYRRRPRGNGTRFVGPGQYIALLSLDERALLVWRKFRDKSGQTGVNCAIFRNENSAYRSSDLIRAAEQIAWQRWPNERLYTYVNPRKIRSTNPGFCFLCAGWQKCGTTTKKLIILEKYPCGTPTTTNAS